MEDDIIELIHMCSFQKSDEEFMGNISVVPEKFVSLMNDRQLSDIKRLCKSNKTVSVLGVDPTCNTGSCFDVLLDICAF